MKSSPGRKRQGKSKKAVVLLSGGMDSYVTAALAKSMGFEIYALTIDYGQSHRTELLSAGKIARRLKVKEHKALRVDLDKFGGSALVGKGRIPKGRKIRAIGSGIPSTYVPARNTVFLSLALAWAEAVSAGAVFIGANALDFSGYPDCRPDYFKAYEKMARLATRAGRQGKGPEIQTPLLKLSKAQIIRKGLALGVDFSLTHTCYDPRKDGSPCRKCDACILRKKGFEGAGVEDPLLRPGKVKRARF